MVVVVVVAGVGAAATLTLAGAGSDSAADRTAYVVANRHVLRGVPVFPGAQVKGLTSSAYRRNEQADAKVAGYGTTREDGLPSATRKLTAYRWYMRGLRARGWTLLERTEGYYFNARKGNAYVHALFGAGAAAIEVDHDCYKGTPDPQCFGP